jgi:hypothetical protein
VSAPGRSDRPVGPGLVAALDRTSRLAVTHEVAGKAAHQSFAASSGARPLLLAHLEAAWFGEGGLMSQRHNFRSGLAASV